MIKEVTGNIFDADVEALVNPVNCVGVMGAGLAKQFKEKYPRYFQFYTACCKAEIIYLGNVHIYETEAKTSHRYLISFPTKRHWKDVSEYPVIKEGLIDLCSVISAFRIASIAIPALGCGLGGLDWEEIKPLIYTILGNLEDVEILLYPPQ